MSTPEATNTHKFTRTQTLFHQPKTVLSRTFFCFFSKPSNSVKQNSSDNRTPLSAASSPATTRVTRFWFFSSSFSGGTCSPRGRRRQSAHKKAIDFSSSSFPLSHGKLGRLLFLLSNLSPGNSAGCSGTTFSFFVTQKAPPKVGRQRGGTRIQHTQTQTHCSRHSPRWENR